MTRGRPFGSMRVLPSGRIQVRYQGPDGLRHRAPMTFGTKTEARRWLSMMEADLARGRGTATTPTVSVWTRTPRGGSRSGLGLSERSVALYQGLLRLHIAPRLGTSAFGRSRRRWCGRGVRSCSTAGSGASTVSKAYRLLRAVLNTAADDELIRRNPCRIKGAGVEHPAERPVLSLPEVMRLADSIDRPISDAGAAGGVRVAAVGRADGPAQDGLRPDARAGPHRARGVVGRFATDHQEAQDCGRRRTVALPMWLVPELEQHFADYSELVPDGRVFVGPSGVTPSRANFSAIWARALKKAGLSGIHVHDLRHTGNHFAAISGASTRELMGRMGHVSVNAAMVYQHRTASRDRAIADSLDAMVEELKRGNPRGSGHVEGTATG